MERFTYKLFVGLLALMLVITSVPTVAMAATTAPSITEDEVLNRIDDLVDIMANKGFTATGKVCDGTNHKSCSNCYTANIVKSKWFTDTFGNISLSQFPTTATYPRSYSCAGFGAFAMWYVFKTNLTDNVRASAVSGAVNIKASFENYKKYAKPGDIIRLNGRHTIMFISANSKDITFIDSNGYVNAPCKVAKRTGLPYKNGTMTIFRANNYDLSEKKNVQSAVVGEGTYYIVSALNGEKSALSISGDSLKSTANVHLWSRHTGDSEKFVVKKCGDKYSVTNLRSGMALDVKGGSKSRGTNVWQYTPNQSVAQQWTFENAGNGYYYIRSALGHYLDVDNARTTDGTNIKVWSSNGSGAQKWKLVPVHYLDLNGLLNSRNAHNISGFGTADVYVNGELVANDVSDYYMRLANDAEYHITDIKAKPGYKFNGVVSGSLSGKMTSAKNVSLSFSKA